MKTLKMLWGVHHFMDMNRKQVDVRTNMLIVDLIFVVCVGTERCLGKDKMKDDLISRQAVIDTIARWLGYLDEDMIERIQISIMRLPSVEADMRET